jgi:hypothetical protein
MIARRRHNLVLAIYPQRSSFAFTVFEGWLAPVDWGVRYSHGAEKNTRCIKRIISLFSLHTPDVLVLQDTSEHGTPRVARIRELNYLIAEVAELFGVVVRTYSRRQVLECFVCHGATTKQMIAETIAKHVPALQLYVPPARKAWSNEHAHMGIFDAAALTWTFFHASGVARHLQHGEIDSVVP